MNTAPCMLITGAARRIGRELSLWFAARGWTIALHYHASAEDAGRTAESIRTAGGKAEIFQTDLRDIAQTRRLMEAVGKKLGPVTCLINNASVFQKDSARESPDGVWDSHFSTHLRAPALLSGTLAKQLPDGAEGCIINITDASVQQQLSPQFLSYSLSKAGLEHLTALLALDLAPRIRVNAIAPGVVLPNPGEEKTFEKLRAASPLNAYCTPEAICRTAEYLLNTPCLTGQVIRLDGGLRLKTGLDT